MSAHCALEQGTSRCIVSLDPGTNDYMWGQVTKLWGQVACEWLNTPQGGERDIQIYIFLVKVQWLWKVKVSRWELWTWMWTQNSDFTIFTHYPRGTSLLHPSLNYLMEFYFIGFVNAHLPGCFCPWTFRLNIGLNTSPSDSFVSYLNSHLGYSAGEFQALQLIVLAVFGAVD